VKKNCLKRKVLKLKNSNLSVNAIADRLGCHPATVYRHLKSDRDEAPKLSKEIQKWLIKQADKPLEQIASKLGLSLPVVSHYYRHMGIIKKNVPPSIAVKIVDAVNKGRSQSKVARDLGISKQLVNYHFLRFKDTIPVSAHIRDRHMETARSTLEIQVERLLSMGICKEEIQERLGVSGRVVDLISGELPDISEGLPLSSEDTR